MTKERPSKGKVNSRGRPNQVVDEAMDNSTLSSFKIKPRPRQEPVNEEAVNLGSNRVQGKKMRVIDEDEDMDFE